MQVWKTSLGSWQMGTIPSLKPAPPKQVGIVFDFSSSGARIWLCWLLAGIVVAHRDISWGVGTTSVKQQPLKRILGSASSYAAHWRPQACSALSWESAVQPGCNTSGCFQVPASVQSLMGRTGTGRKGPSVKWFWEERGSEGLDWPWCGGSRGNRKSTR